MSARVCFMKRAKDCKDVTIRLCKMNSEDGQVYSVCILQFSCFTPLLKLDFKSES